MTYTCYQGNEKDCGFAALKMLMANRTNNESYLYVKKPTKKKEYTFSDLTKYARKYGFTITAYEMPVEDFKQIEPKSLVMLKPNHLVYFSKVTKRRVIYYDPEVGKVKMSHKQFESIWTGMVLECVNSKDATDIDIKKPKFVPFWMDLIHYAIVGVVFASLLVGFYLIKDDSSIILTMVFLLLFAIGELVENWYIIKELKYFDKRFLETFFSHRENQNIEQYKSYIEYKTKYFIVAKMLVSNLIIITAFAVLLCINDYRNVFVFLILLLVKMMDKLLFSKQEKDEVREIDGIEATAFDSPTTITHSLMRANNLANRVGLKRSIKKIVYLFICLCLAVGMMIVSNVLSTNFIIFHFGIYYMVSEAIEGVLTYFTTSKDRKLRRARFLDDCDL